MTLDIKGAIAQMDGEEAIIRRTRLSSVISVRDLSLWEYNGVGFAYEEGLAFLPVERVDHPRHRLGLSVREVGQALENVVSVYPATAVFPGQ